MASDRSPTAFSLMIVEDDSTARNAMARMVARKFPRCTIYTAGNGVQGLELFKHFTPDIVVTDVNMPVMDGVEMISEIKSIFPEAAYIVLTAYSDKRNLKRVNDLDVSTFLIKPLSFKQLFAAIEKCNSDIKKRESVPEL